MKEELIGKFKNEYGEKYEIWIKDDNILFKGDETDWEFMQFNSPDFMFNTLEMMHIIKILTGYCKKKFVKS